MFWPEEFHALYSPWGHKESDPTEPLSLPLSFYKEIMVRAPVCAGVALVLSNSFDSTVVPWTVAHQAPLSLGFSIQEYGSRLPCPAPGDLPDSGIKSRYPALKANSLPPVPPGKPDNHTEWLLSNEKNLF